MNYLEQRTIRRLTCELQLMKHIKGNWDYLAQRREDTRKVCDGFRQQKSTCIEAGVFCDPEPKLKQMKGSEKEISYKVQKNSPNNQN